LCMDGNNLVNGSIANVNGQFFNQTGLYQSPACTNTNFDGCVQTCLTSKSQPLDFFLVNTTSDSVLVGEIDTCAGANLLRK
jgi:hypothetical protein